MPITTAFDLSDEQAAIRAYGARFRARASSRPTPWTGTRTKHFPVETLRKAARARHGRHLVREESAAPGLRRLDAALIFEALSTGCPSIAAYLSIHNMAAWMIDRFGDERQRRDWLPKLCTMECARELLPDRARLRLRRGGAEDAAPSATAIDYVLNGAKQFISGAGASDLYVIMARTGDDGRDGHLRLRRARRARPASPSAPTRRRWAGTRSRRARSCFDGARVPVANRLGAEGDGFKIAMAGLDGGRLNIAACSLGGAQAASTRRSAYMQRARGVRAAARASSRRCSSASPTWRPSWRRRACCSIARRRRSTPAPPTPRCSAPWPSASPPIVGFRSPTRRCSCTAATAICRVRHREDRARPARASDPRGHQRDHAADHRARDPRPEAAR